MNFTPGECAIIAIACSLVTHLHFRRYSFEAPRFFLTLGYLAVAPAVLGLWCISSFHKRWAAFLFSYSVFYTSLLFITLFYRLSHIHPLAKYPGPILARISKLWLLQKVLDGKQHVLFKNLHDTYGPIVRVGPNELSFVDVRIVPAFFGEGMGKGHAWEARHPPEEPIDLLTIREPLRHAKRRKAWNKALSTTSIKECEPRLVQRVQQLVECLHSRSKSRIDLSYWLACFSFDFSVDLTFGGGIELMRDGDENGLIQVFENGLKGLGLLQAVPWATEPTWKLPKISRSSINPKEWSLEFSKCRQERGSAVKDIFHQLMNEDSKEGFSPHEIAAADSLLAIVASYDTATTALRVIFYYLLTHPAAGKKLMVEVEAANELDSSVLATLPYLNAVINEGLRLQPPIPTMIQRTPLPGTGGKQLGSEFIPEGTSVNLPPYVMHRDPRYFSPFPNSFIPERWLKQVHDDEKTEDMKFFTNTNAFIPFSGGFANCVGKNLAMVVMRLVVCSLVKRFDMRFAEGYDLRKWEEDLKSWLLTKTGELPVILSARA